MNKVLLGLLLGTLLGAIDCGSCGRHFRAKDQFGASRDFVWVGRWFYSCVSGRLHAARLLLRNYSAWQHRGNDRGIRHATVRRRCGRSAGDTLVHAERKNSLCLNQEKGHVSSHSF